tara:strand:+ start:349 stop:828 length:480 start_codon:yes stop_codon:yes gene_type:complete
MNKTIRYTDRELPQYAHLPGETPHPKKSGGHSENLKDPISHSINLSNWNTHSDYLFGVDLYNLGYFWEAHVWWEAVWKANQKGPERDFIQGLIKMAAGALKERMGQSELATDHCVRGHELMSRMFVEHDLSHIFGVSRIWWNNSLNNIPTYLELDFDIK